MSNVTSLEPKHESYIEPELEESGKDSSDLLSTAFTGQDATATDTSSICGCCFC